ncbi:uncharacterized protein LOC133520315 [Cydia pomonella]|uniref:uncharacterized protein LOC133520315 n=1 Tax=Cydia pomonella TaxID=82600 RepID=UPI002ADE2C5C|nr:uncharacterized protein LOC133520315 [Cydia pomonella]
MSDNESEARKKNNDEPRSTRATLRVSTDASEICRVSVKVPPFWPEEPEIWFAQIEGQFHVGNITQDVTKFNYVVSQLDQQYLKEVKDIVISPPATEKYDKLKAELIKRLTASKEKKQLQMVMHEELGDRKPSQFLRQLKSLGGPTMPEDFIKTLWTTRLPMNIQTFIAGQPDTSLEDLAERADRIKDLATSPQVASTSTSGPGSHMESLANEVAELKKQMQSMHMKLDRNNRYPRCSQSYQPSRSQSGQRSNSSYRKFPVCWVHAKYGKRATKCIKPCDFGSENLSGNQ